jgi:hypothetical protein
MTVHHYTDSVDGSKFKDEPAFKKPKLEKLSKKEESSSSDDVDLDLEDDDDWKPQIQTETNSLPAIKKTSKDKVSTQTKKVNNKKENFCCN